MNTTCKCFGKAIWWAIGSVAFVAGVQAQTTPAVPTITTSLAAMTFQYQLGAATLPAAQTIQVLSAPVGLSFTVDVAGHGPHGRGGISDRKHRRHRQPGERDDGD